MKIKNDNYHRFYFGESNEIYIQSEFYSLGYEALKTSPDIGYDLLVTNCARTKFLNEKPRQYNIQVKASVYYEKPVYFFIDEEDFNDILNDENGYLICVLCKPKVSDGKENITIYRDQIPAMIDQLCEDYEKEILKNTEYLSLEKIKKMGIPYVGYDRKYFWFNSAQLKRLKVENLVYKKDDRFFINIEPSSMSIVDDLGNALTVESNSLYGKAIISFEQQHIKYLVDCNNTNNKMFVGDTYI